jgi:ppGpp synthetase/RelA/SpoT-type nucleotidyltranferase
MAISEPTILDAVARYQREYDRYLKLCARVADICRYEIIEGNAIRAQVTFRAKSPKSFENKLRRFAATGTKDMPTTDSVFAQVRDLAAVRIATYEQNDEKKVSAALCRRFTGGNGSAVVPDQKDKHRTDPTTSTGPATSRSASPPRTSLERTPTSTEYPVRSRSAA